MLINHPPDPGAPRAHIVILGWRDAPHLSSCIDALSKAVPQGLARLTVVLNEPDPGLLDHLATQHPDVQPLTFQANLGFGAAINVAAERTVEEFLVLLNDDAVVEDGWLEALIDTADRRPRAGAVGSTFLHTDGRLQEAGSILWSDGTTSGLGDGGESPTRGEWDFERRVDYCSGGSLLVRTTAWNQVNGFDDRYYPAYYEDIDLCLRLDESGWETWYQPRSVVTHIRSASSDSHFRDFIFGLNRAAFIQRWHETLTTKEFPGNFEEAAFAASGKTRRLLVLDDYIPEPQLGSGFGRSRDMLFELAKDPDNWITFHPTNWSAADRTEFSHAGIRIVHDLPGHLATDGVSFDVVIVSRPHTVERFHSLLVEELSGCRFIYDAEALYHRRLNQQVTQAVAEERSELEQAAAAMKALESSAFLAADAVVCISESEAEAVRETSAVPVTVISALLENPQPTPQSFASRADIGFVAGWSAGPGAPNSDALRWFATEVLPLVVAELPSARLLVTGGDPPEDVAWLAGPHLEFVGMIPDLSQFYGSIRTAISPTRFGAGIKLKTMEAVQFGVPVVATVEGAAGLEDQWQEAISISDEPQAFAAALVDLLTDEAAWEQRRARGLDLVRASRERGDGMQTWHTVIEETLRGDINPQRRDWSLT